MEGTDQENGQANEKMLAMLLKARRKKISRWSEWPSSKSLQITNAGEGVEKMQPSYTLGGNINWYRHYRGQYGGSLDS